MNQYRLQFPVLIILFAVIFSSGLFGQSEKPASAISVESSVDRDKITIGDLIKYSVIVRRNPDVEVQMPPPGANLGMFEIRDYNIAEPDKENKQIVEQINYSISTFETGEFEIPPLGIRYTVAGDTTVQELRTESIKITVESLKPSEEGDIRDIKMPLEIPRSYRQLIFIIIVCVLVIAIGVLSFFFIKRYKEGKSLIPKRAKLPRPPHEVALEDLEKLVASNLLASSEVKKYYVTISEIIRRYIEGRFFIIALEMTTTQLLDNMQQANIAPETIELTREFLENCDLVKFAKYIPTNEENEKIIQQAFDFVNQTKLFIEEVAEEEAEELVEETEEPASEYANADTITETNEVAETTLAEVAENQQNRKKLE